ncbi:MAG: biopolymer transporter ExbD [Planctomycetota bacterium]|nr:MAG: biopolymer transporter ExbD [Planctomycetota bacterium]
MRMPEPPDEDPGFNLTPMIDVVFQLLIFFMLATTYQDPEKEMEIELPVAQSGNEQKKEPEELIINVFQDGRVSLQGQVLDETALSNALKNAALRDPDTQVTIRGDRLVHHENVVHVMDACQVAGLQNLAVGTLDVGNGK